MGDLASPPPPREAPGCGAAAARSCGLGCGGLLVLLLLLAVAHNLVTARYAHLVQAKLKQLRAAGEPLTAADLAPPPVPADQNAAPLYLEAARLIAPHMGDYGTHPTTIGYETMAWSNDQDVEVAVRLADQDQAVADLVRRATGRPQCRFDGAWTGRMVDAPSLGSKLRALAYLEGAAALAASRRGDRPAALERLLDGFVLCRRLSEGAPPRTPSWDELTTHALVWSAQYVAARGPLPEGGARRLAEEVGRLDSYRAAAKEGQAWRVVGVELAHEFKSGRLSPGGRGFFPKPGMWLGGPPDAVVLHLYSQPLRQVLYRDELSYLGLIDRGEALLGKPWRSTSGEVKRLEADVAKASNWPLITSRLAAIGYPWPAEADTVAARQALLQVALGLEVYRQHHGRYPDHLGDLRSLNWPVPDDPFSGKPLVYRRRGDDYLLYSIGMDLKDDGGRPLYWLVRDRGESQRLSQAQASHDDGDLVWLPWR